MLINKYLFLSTYAPMNFEIVVVFLLCSLLSIYNHLLSRLYFTMFGFSEEGMWILCSLLNIYNHLYVDYQCTSFCLASMRKVCGYISIFFHPLYLR